ncbi:MAG: NF038122 family metalloprotease [Betaproteobacteria bacterium]|nr:NF038122 family metalloprotease [Betaproteobacteria bacterium]
MQQAANIIDSAILNPIKINIQIGWGENSGAFINGNTDIATGSYANAVEVSYSRLTSALYAAANADYSLSLVKSLPAINPAAGMQWEIGQAQAQALNVIDPYAGTVAGSVGFASNVSWNFGSGSNAGYDFLACAIHEITHVLGRMSFPAPGWGDSLNLYDYSANGVLQLSAGGAPGYFSVNGGATNLGNFNTNGDMGDWAGGVVDSFGAGQAGSLPLLSFTDLQVMAALGYKMAPAYEITGPATINAGSVNLFNIQTIGVAPGIEVAYTISGINPSQLMSGTMTGMVAIDQNGIGSISLGVETTAPDTVTITLGNNSAATSVNVVPENAINLTAGKASVFSAVTENQLAANLNNMISGGGTGLDVVSYSGNYSDYTVTRISSGLVVTDLAGTGKSDALVGISRLQFKDVSVAFDLGGNAGIAAEMLGAVAGGVSALSNPVNVGAALKLVDGGMGIGTLAQYELNAKLGAGFTNAQEIQLLYQNLFGKAPGTQDVSYWNGTIVSGQYSQESLAVLAAQSEINAVNINLAGLAQHGLEYLQAA